MKIKKRYALVVIYEILHLVFLLFYSANQLNEQPVAWYAAAPLLIIPFLLAWMRFTCTEPVDFISKLFGLTKLIQAIGLAGSVFTLFAKAAVQTVSYSVFFVLLLLIFILFNGILSAEAFKVNGEICK